MDIRCLIAVGCAITVVAYGYLLQPKVHKAIEDTNIYDVTEQNEKMYDAKKHTILEPKLNVPQHSYHRNQLKETKLHHLSKNRRISVQHYTTTKPVKISKYVIYQHKKERKPQTFRSVTDESRYDYYGEPGQEREIYYDGPTHILSDSDLGISHPKTFYPDSTYVTKPNSLFYPIQTPRSDFLYTTEPSYSSVSSKSQEFEGYVYTKPLATNNSLTSNSLFTINYSPEGYNYEINPLNPGLTPPQYTPNIQHTISKYPQPNVYKHSAASRSPNNIAYLAEYSRAARKSNGYICTPQNNSSHKYTSKAELPNVLHSNPRFNRHSRIYGTASSHEIITHDNHTKTHDQSSTLHVPRLKKEPKLSVVDQRTESSSAQLRPDLHDTSTEQKPQRMRKTQHYDSIQPTRRHVQHHNHIPSSTKNNTQHHLSPSTKHRGTQRYNPLSLKSSHHNVQHQKPLGLSRGHDHHQRYGKSHASYNNVHINTKAKNLIKSSNHVYRDHHHNSNKGYGFLL